MRRSVIAFVVLLGLALAGALLWFVPSRTSEERGHPGRPAGGTPALQSKETAPTDRSAFLSAAEGERSKVRGQVQPTTPPAALDPASIPPAVRPIFGLAGEPFFQRLEAVKNFVRGSNPDETRALFAFVATRPAPQADRRALDLEAALKNDVLNALRFQPQPSAGLTDLLAGIYRDREQDIVMRDYAVQHMVSWYEQLPESDVAARELIQQVFQQALAETDSSIAGTALLGMHNLSVAYPEFDTPELADTALRLAKDETASELVRITALQVCAGRGIKDALPSALVLANAAPTIPVQISAIAALGTLGTAEHRALLEDLAEGPEPRVRPAAENALKRLEGRLAQASVRRN